MTTDTRNAIRALLALAAFLAAIFLITATEDIILIGECQVGPAAPTACEWDERR